MSSIFEALTNRLPGARWLPRCVARLRASIQTKLLAAFLAIVALMIVLGAVGLRSLQDANARAAELVQLERQIAAYRQLQHNATGQLYATASAFLASDEREISAARRQLQRLAYDFDRAQFISQQDRELLQQIQSDYADFIAIATRVVEEVSTGHHDAARMLHHDELVPLANRLERNAYTLVNLAESSMVEQVDLSAEAYRLSQWLLITAAIGSVLLALVLGYSISSSLIVPIRGIRQSLRKIAEGELEQRVEVDNNDELGDLARNANRMSRNLNQLYQQLEEANRHKSTFLANMSHELRTPMNAIIGFNRLVMRRCQDVLPQKQYENLAKIAVAADQLLTLINSILDLSKIEAGRMDINPTEAPLAPMLESCARTAEPLLDCKTVKLVTEIDSDLPPVFTDHDRLRQIVLNFLSNAAKFTEHGTITLAGRAAGDRVTISISDTGIGIPEDKLATIFDEFSQVDASTTRRYAGTGLGLAISRHLAGLLGGEVSVESAVGEGSTFSVTIPARYRQGFLEEENGSDAGAQPERIAS